MDKLFGKVKSIVKGIDPMLFFCATLLSVISILTIWGAVDNFGMSKLRMQIFIFFVGIVVTVLISTLDYRVIVDKLWIVMLVGSVILLLITLIWGSTGADRETANRSWLTIPGTGLMIQPSEFVKFTFICTFARHLYTVQKDVNKPKTLLLLLLHAGAVVGPILLSGDLGVALIYCAIIAIMLFCAGLHPGYFAAGLFLAVLLSPFLWASLEDYQQQRIIIGFYPELDPMGKGMQPLMSRDAIAAGGFFGQGIFGGSLYEPLPASHTDFIFATVCEKFGFLGGSVVIILFMLIVSRIFMVARSAGHSDFGGLICVGVGAMLVVQILLNVGMCFAMLPVIGITLPFLSCGGSSMLATFMMFGLVHNVYAHSHGVKADSVTDTLDIDISLYDS
ncbi:MAG: FtsW/RodA/SpoVE family cell cycle protein [Clostridia bacterium]|nr:FtsW/RodA/SpoVE family cell cycle protein [Clostridia bacterium]